MSKYKKIDLSKVKTYSIQQRKSKVELSLLAKTFDPKKDSFSDYINSLPKFLAVNDLKEFAQLIVKARKKKKPIIFMIGAHVIKVGLSPILIDLMKNDFISAIAMNSAGAIHDSEIAFFGKTSEDVAAGITDGSFGMAEETGEFINSTLSKYEHSNIGYGEALAIEIKARKAKNKNLSLLYNAYELDKPITVHAAIGTDITHQHPNVNGSAIGRLSLNDFQILCEVVSRIGNGGVVANIGSNVILPEVFLKALTIARNLGYKVFDFTTANFDFIQHYRPRVNVVQRPTQDGGKGFMFTGHHEIMIPLLAAMIKHYA
ncbi:MAG: hypothetical protein N3F03_00280 [Ignavibacteria bacterium]|nr:hypothetical protein [Ignavibacteria bacterium]